MNVTLSDAQFGRAVEVGKERQRRNQGRQDSYDMDPALAERNHVKGAVWEIACGVALGILDFWNDLNPMPGGADFFEWLEVRGRPRHDYDLLLHPKDPDAHVWLLVTGPPNGRSFILQGWCWGREGKLKLFWGDRCKTNRPCFWVPQHVLRPMDILVSHLESLGGVGA